MSTPDQDHHGSGGGDQHDDGLGRGRQRSVSRGRHRSQGDARALDQEVGPPQVVVVGGGIAGLAAAWELAGRDVLVEVLEARGEVGGKLRQAEVGGVLVDVGPDAFVARRREAVDLCDEIGLLDELVSPGASGAQVWSRGRLRRLPDGLVLGIPTRLGPLARSGIVSPLATARAAADLLARRPLVDDQPDQPDQPYQPHRDRRMRDRAVAELVGPRLGRQVTTQLVDPLVGGIHAGSVASMSAEAVFPALLRAAAHPGSLMRALRMDTAGPSRAAVADAGPAFLSVRGGMARLAGRLAGALTERGVTVRTSCPVTALRMPGPSGARWEIDVDDRTLHADAVVLALPAPDAARLLGTAARAGAGTMAAAARYLARSMGAIDSSGVAVVTLAFAPGGTADRWQHAGGTGFLVPVTQGLLTTGCTWLSTKWPHLAPEGPVLVRLSAGRAGDGRALELPDGALVGRLLGELRAVAGDVEDPADVDVTRWSDAFPQYRVGHRSWVGAVRAAVGDLPGLALAGATFDGIGIPACVGSGRSAARSVAAGLGR